MLEKKKKHLHSEFLRKFLTHFTHPKTYDVWVSSALFLRVMKHVPLPLPRWMNNVAISNILGISSWRCSWLPLCFVGFDFISLFVARTFLHLSSSCQVFCLDCNRSSFFMSFCPLSPLPTLLFMSSGLCVTTELAWFVNLYPSCSGISEADRWKGLQALSSGRNATFACLFPK